MKATRTLHDLGQSLRLDNITRGLLESGTLARYINELSVTGSTSSPTIFDTASNDTDLYDDASHCRKAAGTSGEALLFELAVEAAFAEHGDVTVEMPPDGGDAESLFAEIAKAGVDDATLAARLQRERTQSFLESWNDLLECIAAKSALLPTAGRARETGR